MTRRRRPRASLTGAWAGALILAALPHAAQAQRAGVAEQLPPNAPPAVQACVGCHGAQGEGNPQSGTPRIAGQSQRYLLKQLDSYADGTRRSQVMAPIARGLPPEIRAEVAAYYAQQVARVVEDGEAGGAPPERGRVLATRGDNGLGVQACRNCHGPGGVGEPPNIPYLAGLSADYIVSELLAWKQGTRTNDAGQQMFTVVTGLPRADMEAVAQYYASLPPPEPVPLDLVQVPAQPLPRPGTERTVVEPAQPQGRVGAGGGATRGGTQGAGGTGGSTNVAPERGQTNRGGGEQAGRGDARDQPAGGTQWPAIIEQEPQRREPQSFAPAMPGDPERGRAIVASGEYGCPACHAIPGIDWPRGIVGPPLENFAQRALIAGRLPNDPQTLAAFVFDPPAMIPDTGMPDVGLTFEQARHVAAYLCTLGVANGG